MWSWGPRGKLLFLHFAGFGSRVKGCCVNSVICPVRRARWEAARVGDWRLMPEIWDNLSYITAAYKSFRLVFAENMEH
jgi:hypothetical protein